MRGHCSLRVSPDSRVQSAAYPIHLSENIYTARPLKRCNLARSATPPICLIETERSMGFTLKRAGLLDWVPFCNFWGKCCSWERSIHETSQSILLTLCNNFYLIFCFARNSRNLLVNVVEILAHKIDALSSIDMYQ